MDDRDEDALLLLEDMLLNSSLALPAKGEGEGRFHNDVTVRGGRYLFRADAKVRGALELLARVEGVSLDEMYRLATTWYLPRLREDLPLWREIAVGEREHVAAVVIAEVVGAFIQRRIDEVTGAFSLAATPPESLAQC